MRTPTIVARGLSKSFRNGPRANTVLHDLSLTCYAGELTLISGPSGCGKSTLLAIISGLLRPDAGDVEVLGQSLWSRSAIALDRFRLEHTGFVFQGFNLFPALSALEQILLPLKYLGLMQQEALRRGRQALTEVGLSGFSDARPDQLSGGEKQRVAIARALAKQPDFLFADEPTSALDAANGAVIIELLHAIASKHDTTVVCVSHDPRLVTHADRVFTMEDGRIIKLPSPEARRAYA